LSYGLRTVGLRGAYAPNGSTGRNRLLARVPARHRRIARRMEKNATEPPRCPRLLSDEDRSRQKLRIG